YTTPFRSRPDAVLDDAVGRERGDHAGRHRPQPEVGVLPHRDAEALVEAVVGLEDAAGDQQVAGLEAAGPRLDRLAAVEPPAPLAGRELDGDGAALEELGRAGGGEQALQPGGPGQAVVVGERHPRRPGPAPRQVAGPSRAPVAV